MKDAMMPPAEKTETLFELGQELDQLNALLTESAGELTPEIEAWFDAFRAKLAAKVDGIGWFIRTCETRAAGYKAIAEDMTTKRRTEENKVQRLKDYVLACMRMQEERELKGRAYTFAIQRNGGKPPLTLNNENPEAFPASCVRTVKVIDKEAVRAAVEAGTLAPELATLEPVGEHVRLR